MHPGTLKALEFDRVVAAVRSLALTPLGSARLAELAPATDARRVQHLLAATSETASYLRQHQMPLRAPADLPAILGSLAVQGRALEAMGLLGLADFLQSVEHVRAAIRRAGSVPILTGIAASASGFDDELAEVRRAIEPSGDVSDNASPQLRLFRERLRKQRARLRNALESYLRGRETAKYLQDQIVTDRHGRYVLVVRSEHRTAIPGIVHGASASGASLYLEPLSTVEINNDVVALVEQEREEVHRVLLELSDRFRARALELQRTLEAATEFDVLQAKAGLSHLSQGIEPELSTDGRLELRGARHPLLIAGVAERAGGVGDNDSRSPFHPVPVDVLLIPPSTALVITGPNTGGKTVALKTAGLLTLMAQAGLHVPAEAGTRVPVCRTIFADIGDEQSIAASLSTFSSHITNIAAMDRALSLPALVLFDEIGAGTDPVEGGALGIAIIEHFRRRGALVIATTHYDTLKSYGATTDGVATAAFGFDPQTFAPTYRLLYGTAGRSLALEIAGRLGLPASIVGAARQHRSAREAQLAEHLARVDRDVQALDHERRLVTRGREQLADAERRLEARDVALAAREEAIKERLNKGLDERLREAKRDIDRVVDDLKQRAAAMAADAARYAPRLSTGDTGGVRAAARSALDGIAQRFDGVAAGTVASAAESATLVPPGIPAGTLAPAEMAGHAPRPAPTPGARVAVGTLGLQGILRTVQDQHADVEVNGKRLRVSIDDLRQIEGTPAPAARVNVNVTLHPRGDAGAELNIIGCTVDEALTRVERFLDQAIMGDQRSVRFIHGHGTGQLRRAIAGFLDRHPLVASYASAPPEQGGGGVTVAELKD